MNSSVSCYQLTLYCISVSRVAHNTSRHNNDNDDFQFIQELVFCFTLYSLDTPSGCPFFHSILGFHSNHLKDQSRIGKLVYIEFFTTALIPFDFQSISLKCVFVSSFNSGAPPFLSSSISPSHTRAQIALHILSGNRFIKKVTRLFWWLSTSKQQMKRTENDKNQIRQSNIPNCYWHIKLTSHFLTSMKLIDAIVNQLNKMYASAQLAKPLEHI